MKPSVAVLAGLVFGSIGVVCIVVAVAEIASGEVPSAVVALGGAAFCLGFVIPLFKTVPGRVTPRVRSDGTATTFRPDPGIELPMQAAVAGGVLSCVLILILLPAGKLAIPVPPTARYALPFSASFVVAYGVPVMWRSLRRGSISHLRLTSDGFEFAQGWRPRSGRWTAVQDVAAEAPNQKAPTPGAIVFVMTDGTALTFVASAYTADGAALRDLVRHYWQYPEDRDELTDDRACTSTHRGTSAKRLDIPGP